MNQSAPDQPTPDFEDPRIPPQKIVVDPSLRSVKIAGTGGSDSDSKYLDHLDVPVPEVMALTEDRFKNFAVDKITHVVIQVTINRQLQIFRDVGYQYDWNEPWPFWDFLGQIVSKALFDGKTQLQEFNFIAIRRREFIAFTTSMWRDAGGPIRPPRNRSSPGSEPEPKALDELPPLNVIEVNFNRPQTNKPMEFTWMPARALFTAKIKEWNQPWTESENGSAPDRVLISPASKEIEGEGS